MYKIGDYVKVIKGLHNGSEGTVAKISKNDMGTITYEIHVEKLFKRIGNISKREGEIEMAKRGRPVKNASKIEQLKEVTKQVVEMTEEPTATVDEPVEPLLPAGYGFAEIGFDEVTSEEENNNFAPTYAKGGVIGGSSKVELEVGEVILPIDEIKGTVDKVEEPPKPMPPYECLIDFYRKIGRNLSVPELEAFCDNVTADLKASKEVLEKMYQMPVGILAKIREEIA